MHGRHHFAEHGARAFWLMAGRGGRGGPFGGPGMRGGGRGGPFDRLRAGRMLGDGDLKLIALYLLDEAPRHGYDIIKALEERSSGIYSPSPGVVYPTLTFLEEAGYASSSAEGAKKVFSITAEGKAYLAENRELVERVLAHLERFGRKMAAAREWFGWDDAEEHRGRGDKRNPELRDLRRRLRAALAEILDGPAERQAEAADILRHAAEALEALSQD
ncbi:PadR family transcriptional regulator [Mesorhizobium sp. SP-1A]|uniref:PadR family transcriptional regulator n=1 Tax=Mesorhizobium sp. SP-1A TaxID=3077840 RepID=UPI0028F6C755|nr:PadR family transcriptional regulator [Mesorhizobium sp. SP-1A]